MALGVFVAVKQGFEAVVVALHPGYALRSVTGQPGLWVLLGQCPEHDVQALGQQLAIWQHQQRHGSRGRERQQRSRFVAQGYLL